MVKETKRKVEDREEEKKRIWREEDDNSRKHE